jgi:hypothetical protein
LFGLFGRLVRLGLSAVLFVNPDRAGPRRFRLPVTLAYLTLGAAGLRARVVHLVPER